MTNDDDPVVTVRDAINAGFCAPGFVRWVKDNGFDYKKFKSGEYHVSDFAHVNDAYADQVREYIAKQTKGDQS